MLACAPQVQIRISEVPDDTPSGAMRITLGDAEVERRWVLSDHGVACQSAQCPVRVASRCAGLGGCCHTQAGSLGM